MLIFRVFLFVCFKLLLYVLKCVYTEIGGIFPLGTYMYLSINMNIYIHMHVNNFEM